MSQQPRTTGEYSVMEEDILGSTLDLGFDLGTANLLQPAQTWPMVNLDAYPWALSNPESPFGYKATNFPVIDNYDGTIGQWPIAVSPGQVHLHSGDQLSQSAGNWLADTTLAQQSLPVQQSNPSAAKNRFNCDKCPKTFTRPDTLKRHLNSSCKANGNNRQGARVTCDLCNEGTKTFLRADHLLQHLRGFHKMSERAVERYKVRAGKRAVTSE